MSMVNGQQRYAVWSERLRRFGMGSVTVAEFCRREAVSVPSFYAWRKRLKESEGAKAPSVKNRDGDAKFLSVVVSAAIAQPMLKLPGGAVIELPSQLGQRQLVDLIAAVVEATDAARRSAEVA